jgi:tetratricopeptide (TPR) repeat protein
LPFSQFREVLGRLVQIGIPQPESQLRKEYLAGKDELRAKARRGVITLEERVNLGEYLIRLYQYDEAIEVLTPAAAQDRANFMVLANLAVANQHSGRLDRAISYLESVHDTWPSQWGGLTREQLEWYRLAEKYHLRLVRLRFREMLRPSSGRAKPPESLDDLFGVHFIGPTGEYEAGTIAPQERDKLPKESVAIVQQLLIWLPDDTRLYWLLGELYNAAGDVRAAADIFDDCVWRRRFSADELKNHRNVLQESKPRPVEQPASWLPGKRQVFVVIGGAGLLILVLSYLQFREMRRRRKIS